VAAAVTLVLAFSPATGHARPLTTDLERRIAAAAQRLESLIERHNAVRDDLRATRVRLAGTAARIDGLAADVDDARERVNEIAAWAYKAGPTSPIVAVLTAGSPDTLVRRLTTLDSVTRGHRRSLSALAEAGHRLDRDRSALRWLADSQDAQAAELGRLVSHVRRDLESLRALRRQVGPASRSGAARSGGSRSSRPPPPPPPPPPADDDQPGERAVRHAYAQLGKPYVFGAAGPRAYDCSGLTKAAWRMAGVHLPHNAARQYRALPRVSRGDLRPGDLVFYYWDLHHVAIYVGRGMVIHAPNPDQPVSVSRLNLGPIHGFGRPG
jgi:peptidoglycan DL-endopeptidase CwlO